VLRLVKLNILKKLYYGLKDIRRKLLNRLYCRSKSIRSPGGERTLFYIRVNNSLLIPLSGIAKQLLAFISGVNRFNKKLLDLFLVLDEITISL